MVYVVALFFNVLGNMTFWIIISKQSDPDTPPATGEAEAPGNFAKSLLWLVIFSPCSMCWYIPAYRAFKSDSSFNFFIFFFIFFFQVRKNTFFYIFYKYFVDLLASFDGNWCSWYGILWMDHCHYWTQNKRCGWHCGYDCSPSIYVRINFRKNDESRSIIKCNIYIWNCNAS